MRVVTWHTMKWEVADQAGLVFPWRMSDSAKPGDRSRYTFVPRLSGLCFAVGFLQVVSIMRNGVV